MSEPAPTSPASATIGGEYNPLDPAFARELYHYYARARRDAPICYAPHYNLWLVSRYEDIVAILKDTDRFSSAAAAAPAAPIPPEVQAILDEGYERTPMLIGHDPPEHARIRALVGSAFTPQRVAAMAPSVRALAHELVDGFAGLGQVDIMREFAFPLPFTVITELIGVPRDDRAQVKAWHNDIVAATNIPGLPVAVQAAHARRAVDYQRYVAALVEERRAAPRGDIATSLAEARTENAEPLSTPEIVWLLMFLIAAGHDTTTNLIGNMLLHFMREPAQWQSLSDDPKLIAAAIEETLRIDPSFLPVTRVTTGPVTLHGVELPKGALVALLIGSGNHDEAVFDAPEQFDIRRPRSKPHLGLGHGIHYCVGAPLGRLEARIALEVLRERLPNLRLTPGFVPAYAPNFLFRALAQLPLVWDVS
jgi:cytochrome P450